MHFSLFGKKAKQYDTDGNEIKTKRLDYNKPTTHELHYQIYFLPLHLLLAIGYFAKNVKKLIRNIKLGQDVDVSDNKSQRWKNMAMIALGQSKMVNVVQLLVFYMLLYMLVSSVINIEVLEIIIDGLFGTHRIFS